jgi:Arc/MetJ-type ribon-helix-helix transcriptional regulator
MRARRLRLTVSMTESHTASMSVTKVTISIDESLLNRIDRLVRVRVFPSRSQVIQQALEEKIARIDRTRLARECAKLRPAEEQALADEGLAGEAAQWPEY